MLDIYGNELKQGDTVKVLADLIKTQQGIGWTMQKTIVVDDIEQFKKDAERHLDDFEILKRND